MDEVTKQKKKVHRSPAYPSVDLEKAIPLVEKLFKLFDEDPFSRDTAIKESGLKFGSNSSRKLAALVHFGLINRKGNSYTVSPLTKKILFPDDDNMRNDSITEAAQNPRLYKSLITAYQGRQLPPTFYYKLINGDGFEKFNKDVAERVASDFKKTIEFAGILKNGIVKSLDTDGEQEGMEPKQQAPPSDNPKMFGTDKPNSLKQSLEGVTFPIGKDITLTISENLNRDMFSDKEMYNKFTGILDSLKGLTLTKKEENGTTTGNAPNTPLE